MAVISVLPSVQEKLATDEVQLKSESESKSPVDMSKLSDEVSVGPRGV